MSPARSASGNRSFLLPVPAPAPAAGPELGNISDDDLIEAVVAGDASVASELYDRLHHSVDRTIYRVLGRREGDHEDLVQTTFEQIVKTLATRRFARACSLKTWACSVATHVALNAMRSRRRERGVFDRREEHPDGPALGSDPERDALARRDVDNVRRLLADMSPARAEALFLHDVLGYELAEIAALTGVSIAAAQSRLVRGRHELHEKLGVKKKRGRT